MRVLTGRAVATDEPLQAGSAVRRGLELSVLTGFAIAQPVFAVVSRTPEFFVVRGASPGKIVAFAALVALGVPAVLLLAEVVLDRFGGHGRRLHLLLVAVLAALIAGNLVARLGAAISPWLLSGLALVLAAAATLLYLRVSAVRTYLAFLAPAPVVFLAVFLARAPLSEPALAATSTAGNPAPVVMVVFDEFPLASLLDRRERIDDVRYPNFAALARDSLWFRNASTVHDSTLTAVPAMMTGRRSMPGRAVTALDHPQNLFTLLRRSYEVDATESYTKLCPRSVCEHDPRTVSFPSLLATAGLISLHGATPRRLRERLPPVENIGAAGEPLPSFHAFLERIRPARRPAFRFLHVLMPHNPWRTLPSGLEYEPPEGGVPFPFGFSDPPRWGKEDWLVKQAWQRHLLQTGYVDRMIGALVARLRSAGLYERAIVVVTADHGASFHAGKPFRLTTAEDVSDIASIPLFIKPPGTGAGRLVDAHVRTTDILPTIADLLDLELAEPVEGRSLVAREIPDRETVDVRTFEEERVVVTAEDFERDRRDTLTERIALFGAGETWERVFRLGPRPELVGGDAGVLAEAGAVPTEVEIAQADELARVDPDSGAVPAFVSGRVLDEPAAESANLALVVNGRVAAVVPLRREARFSALISDRLLRPGNNGVEAFLTR